MMSLHASFRVGLSALGSTSTASNLDQPKLAQTGITKTDVDWWKWVQNKAFTNDPNFKVLSIRTIGILLGTAVLSKMHHAPTLDSTYVKYEIRKTFCWQKAVEGLLFKLKSCRICDTHPLGRLPWRQDILPAPGHMWCQWWKPHHQKVKAAKLDGILFGAVWEPRRDCIIPVTWKWNVGGIISGETVLNITSYDADCSHSQLMSFV